MYYLGLLLNLAALVAAIMVLVKLFQTKGAGHGILGLICGIYTFIWGWINHKTLGLTKLMLIWTVGGIVGYGLMVPAMMSQMGDLSKQLQDAAQKAQQEASQPAPATQQ